MKVKTIDMVWLIICSVSSISCAVNAGFAFYWGYWIPGFIYCAFSALIGSLIFITARKL